MIRLLAAIATGLVLAAMASSVVWAVWQALPAILYILLAVLVLAGGSDLLDRLERFY